MNEAESLNFVNSPGVQSIGLLVYSDADQIPPISFGTYIIESDVTLAVGASWNTDFYFTPYTANYSEQEVDLRGDNAWDVRIECFQPGDDEAEAYTRNENQRKRFIVDCKDNDGRRRLVGTKQEPLRIMHQFSIGQKPGERKGTVIILEGRLRKRPPFYAP